MKYKTNISLFYCILLATLTGDMLLCFTSSVLVYEYTKDISMSGLSYFVEWFFRLFLVPMIGGWVDLMGIRKCSIFFDICKIISCLILLAIIGIIEKPSSLAICTGIFSTIIALSNSQTLIVCEKYIVEKNLLCEESLEKDANFISMVDQSAMILGALIGFALYKISIHLIIYVSVFTFAINYWFFSSKLCARKYLYKENHHKIANYSLLSNDVSSFFSKNFSLLLVLFIMVVTSFFSNMLDGMVEASSIAVIFEKMSMPVEYSAFVFIAAGFVGYMATMIFSKIYQKIDEVFLLTIIMILEFISGVGLFMCFSSFMGFIFFYALCIGSKIIRITLTRIYRMRIIPNAYFARVSSIMTVLGQSALPLVGIIIYFSKHNKLETKLIVLFSTFIILASSYFIITKWLTTVITLNEVIPIREVRPEI